MLTRETPNENILISDDSYYACRIEEPYNN